jgi:hypothetical protein
LRTAVVCGSLVASLIAVEVVLRITGFPVRNWVGMSDPVLHHVHPPDAVHAVGDHQPPYAIRFDRDGLIFDPGLRVENPAARVRLALMGDSFVEAADLPYRDSLAGRIEAAADRDTEIRNFGVWSYSPVLYLLQWRMNVRAFRPTHVVLVLFNNDVDDDARYDALAIKSADGAVEAVPAPGRAGIRGVLGRSRLLRLAAFSAERAGWLWQEEQASVPWKDVEDAPDISGVTGEALAALAREVRASGAEFLLTAVPSRSRIARTPGPEPDFSSKCGAWAAAHGVRFLDLTPAFLAEPRDRPLLVVPGDFHWTAAGYRVAAEAVRRSLPDVFGS